MDHKALIVSSGYILAEIQNKLFNVIDEYLKEKNINKTQLAKELGVSKSYVSQVLSGDFDHRISKLVDLALHANKVPQIKFVSKEQVLEEDEIEYRLDKLNKNFPNLIVKPLKSRKNNKIDGFAVKTHEDGVYELISFTPPTKQIITKDCKLELNIY